MRHDCFAEIGPAGAGVAEHELESGCHRVAAAKMEAARGFNEKNRTTRVAELDDFLPVHDGVNMLVGYAGAALSTPIAQGAAGLLLNSARQEGTGALLGG